ncbi:NAD(+)/NADH kinase [Limisalsivibrio acetivorans]|uniref:NAD(+)/NADH kinase n=1 Tax=Limisalsivibrio acetivorans TaxID=1304888 RepID=UPI0003B44786|nr:NAD(+)/NADH kinase [Limisalsivibrio acetivorans]
MKKVSIVAKPHGDRVKQVLEDVCQFLGDKGVEVLLEENSAGVIGAGSVSHERIKEESDLVVVLGGDGTLISAVRILGEKETPILGVNLGRLGFLTETKIEEALPQLGLVLDGDFETEKRMKLHCHLVENGVKTLEIEVLNDVVINKSDLARIIEMEVYVNDYFVNSYRADGLIISTPTGSTAYNLAAGGPIVHPSSETIILAPICPHALTNRPIVISDDSFINIRLRSKEENVSITYDGQIARQVDPEKIITIKKARTGVRLVVPKNRNYYSLLREKLGWGW